MSKRGIESRWCEFCESAPVGEVEQMLRLGRSIVSRRKKAIQRTPAEISIVYAAEVPEHPEPLGTAVPTSEMTLFKRDETGEIEAPF